MSATLLVFWACVAACAMAHAAILRSVLGREGSVSSDVPPPKAWVELVWAAIPLLALALVLLASYPRVRRPAVDRRGTAPLAQSR